MSIWCVVGNATVRYHRTCKIFRSNIELHLLTSVYCRAHLLRCTADGGTIPILYESLLYSDTVFRCCLEKIVYRYEIHGQTPSLCVDWQAGVVLYNSLQNISAILQCRLNHLLYYTIKIFYCALNGWTVTLPCILHFTS